MIVKRFTLFICMFVLMASVAVAEEQYDPQFTLQALNIAIVSIQKIISSENKVILTQEYDNIINNLKTGNIESDYEITSLFEELMKVINSKTIRKEEKERLKAKYEKKEKKQVIEALSGIRAYGGDLYSWVASLLTSCVSQYFSYRNANEELKEGFNDDLWQLKKEELTDINDMRQKLLTSSWNLLRKYSIPDENKLTEKVLENYYKGITNSDAEARLRIIKRQEQYFLAYPQYWIDRANAANSVGNNEEVKKCYDKFDEVWRPVLRKDIYKSTALKYRLKEELLKKSEADKTKIEKYLEELKKYSEDDDWVTNILIGITYFQIGNKEKAEDSVLANIDSEYETEISSKILEKIKAGKIEDNFLFDYYTEKLILSLIPEDNFFLVHINLSKILLPEIKKLFIDYIDNSEPNNGIKNVYELLKTKFQIEPVNDISNITLLFPEKVLDTPFIIFIGKFDFIKKFLKKIKEDKNFAEEVDFNFTLNNDFICGMPNNSKKESHSFFKFLEEPEKKKEDNYIFLDNQYLDNQYLICDLEVDSVKEFIKGKAKPINSSSVFKKININSDISCAGVIPQTIKDKCLQDPNTSFVANIDSFNFDYNATNNIIWNLNIEVDKYENVNNVMTFLNNYISIIKMTVCQQYPQFAEVLNTIKTTNSSKTISINLDIPTSKCEEIYRQYFEKNEKK